MDKLTNKKFHVSLTSMTSKHTIITAVVVLALIAGVYYATKPKPIEGVVLQPTTDETLLVTVQSESGNEIETDVSGWQIYRNEELGFQFRFPQNLKLKVNLPDKSLTAEGAILGITMKDINGEQSFSGTGLSVSSEQQEIRQSLISRYESGQEAGIQRYEVNSVQGYTYVVWLNSRLADYQFSSVIHDEIYFTFSNSPQGVGVNLSDFLSILASVEFFN